VFQVLDGVPIDEVWSLNREFLLPDLNIFLTADARSIRRRRDVRAAPTRFDQTLRVEDEIRQYRTAAAFMAAHGVRVAEVMNGDQAERGSSATDMANHIHEAIGQH
jgi:thymidylate kinase